MESFAIRLTVRALAIFYVEEISESPLYAYALIPVATIPAKGNKKHRQSSRG